MEETESTVGGQRSRILTIVLIVLVLYILLLGRQGAVTEIAYDSGLVYAAVGSEGGLRILNASSPDQLREVGHFDTFGTASQFAMVGKQVFMADGKSGLVIIDVSDPTLPVAIGALDLVGSVRNVTLGGNYAYLSMWGDGIAVVDINDRARPLAVGSVDTPGTSRAAALMQIFAAPEGIQPDTPEFSLSARLQAVYLYVADGSAGLQVIDVTQPASPRIVSSVNTPGLAQDITMSSFFGFLADGRSGVRVYDLRDPANPIEIGVYDTVDYAREVKLVGTQLYVADGDGGLAVIEVGNLVSPTLVEMYSGIGDLYTTAVVGNMIYLGAGEQGLQVIQTGDGNPYPVGFWETPGDAGLTQLLQGGWYLVTGRPGDIQPKVGATLLKIVFDAALLVALTAFWLVFYAQFILPVSSLSDRRRAAERVAAYHLGDRGPAIFIENGQIRSRRREQGRIGPGVAVIDTASAAVFRTEHSFTRASGPGLVFTRRKEVPAGVIDLHRQARTLGPLDSENPFLPHQVGETPEGYEQRQERRYSTSGLTRDGVEVVPNITVVFSLDSVPGEGGTLFGYKASSAWKAIAREGVDPNAESGQKQLHWSWLPVNIAIDLWREYLRKFTLDELFSYILQPESNTLEALPLPPQDAAIPDTGSAPLLRETAFDEILKSIRERISHPEVDDLDDVGRRTGFRLSSKEHELLQSRGIKVSGVLINNLQFPEEVESRLVDQWQASWLNRAQEETRLVELMHSQKRLEGQDRALKEFAAATAQPLGSSLETSSNATTKESLRMLVQGTLKLCVREIQLSPRLSNQKANLVELIEWIGKQ